jgi:hypothetical protein
MCRLTINYQQSTNQQIVDWLIVGQQIVDWLIVGSLSNNSVYFVLFTALQTVTGTQCFLWNICLFRFSVKFLYFFFSRINIMFILPFIFVGGGKWPIIIHSITLTICCPAG